MIKYITQSNVLTSLKLGNVVPGLESKSVEFICCEQTNIDMSWLQNFPRLKKLELAYHSPLDVEKAVAPLVQLHSLKLQKNSQYSEDFSNTVPKLIETLAKNGLRELHAMNQPYWGQPAVDALSRWISSPLCTLEEVQFSEWQVYYLESLWSALAVNSSLKKFSVSRMTGEISHKNLISIISNPGSKLTYFYYTISPKKLKKSQPKILLSKEDLDSIEVACKQNSQLKFLRVKLNKYDFKLDKNSKIPFQVDVDDSGEYEDEDNDVDSDVGSDVGSDEENDDD